MTRSVSLGALSLLTIIVLAMLPASDLSAGTLPGIGKMFSETLRGNICANNHADFGLDLLFTRSLGGGRWSLTQKPFCISGVWDTVCSQYSWQGPVAAASVGLAYVAKSRGSRDMASVLTSPLFTILALPSSRIEYAITNRFFLGLGNNVEYVLARGHSGERGIYCVPSLTLSFWNFNAGEAADALGFQINIGHTSFWNFDGPGRSMGWGCGCEFHVAGFLH